MTANTGRGAYFFTVLRVWVEAITTGVPAEWFGTLRDAYKLPDKPHPAIVQKLAEGHGVIGKVQKNRMGVIDLTHTWSKSISIFAYGMTQPRLWDEKTKVLSAIVKERVEYLLGMQRVYAGPGRTAPGQGIAVNFNHWCTSRGALLAHSHSCVLNVSVGPDGKLSSVRNIRDLFFDRQGENRAWCNKKLDDLLQQDGYKTVRRGRVVELANMPKELLAEFSPSRAAMEAIRARKEEAAKEGTDPAGTDKRFDTPRAMDFLASAARREMPYRHEPTPDEAYAACQERLKAYGITHDALKKGGPTSGPRPEVEEQHEAFAIVQKATAACTKRFGVFTETQLREWAYTLGIGRRATAEVIDKEVTKLVKEPKRYGFETVSIAGRPFLAKAEELAKLREAEAPSLKAEWEQLKVATTEFTDALGRVLVRKATGLMERLSEWVDPEPKKVVIDGKKVGAFLELHRPTNYWKAHAVAFWRGLLAPGNPHEKAAHAETVFARLRRHDRVPKHVVIVVQNAWKATARELRDMRRIEKRDRCTVLFDHPVGPLGAGKAKERGKGKTPEPPPQKPKNKTPSI